MKALKNIYIIILIIMLCSCGGGGNSNQIANGGVGNGTSKGVGAIGLKSNLSNAAYITLTNSSKINSTIQVGILNNKFIKKFIDLIIPNAYALDNPFNNVLAFDSNGESIPNPLITDVNVFIGAIALDPAGKYLYLGIEDHQNIGLYADYAALTGSKCSLYRINKTTGETLCLADTSEYDLYNPSTNQQMQGNASESFIKFDSAGNGYLIMFANKGKFGSYGTEKQRLVKIDANGSLSIVRDSSAGYARGLAYAKNGKIFYSEDAWFSITAGKSSTFLFNPDDSTFKDLSLSITGGALISDITGRIFVSTGNSVYTLDQDGQQWIQIYQGGDPITWMSRSQSGKAYVLHSSGMIYALEENSRNLLAVVGEMPKSRYKNDASDLAYPPIAINDEYLLAKGTDLAGIGQYCAVRIIDKKSRCAKPSDTSPTYLSLAIVGSKGFVFFETGSQIKMVSFDLAKFIADESLDPLSTLSTAGDGSIIAAISMRPPITTVADLEIVKTKTSDKILNVLTPVYDTYTYLSFTSQSVITGISNTDLILKDVSGKNLDAKFKIIDNAIYASVIDTSGTKSSGYRTLGMVNDYSVVFPSTFTAPVLKNGIGTQSGYFQVAELNSVLYLDFSAPIVNLDLSTLQLIDTMGTPVPSTISMVKDGMQLEIRIKDSDPLSITGFKKIPKGSVYKLNLPSRVRLPGQTFLSPFDITQVLFTTQS